MVLYTTLESGLNTTSSVKLCRVKPGAALFTSVNVPGVRVFQVLLCKVKSVHLLNRHCVYIVLDSSPCLNKAEYVHFAGNTNNCDNDRHYLKGSTFYGCPTYCLFHPKSPVETFVKL